MRVFEIKSLNDFCFSIGSVALGDSYFGQGVGIIFFDELDCVGTEDSLASCTHDGIAASNCFHDEDAGVLCQGMVYQLLCIGSSGRSGIHVYTICNNVCRMCCKSLSESCIKVQLYVCIYMTVYINGKPM